MKKISNILLIISLIIFGLIITPQKIECRNCEKPLYVLICKNTGINIRTGPGTSYPKDGWTVVGEELYVLKEYNGWIRFRLWPHCPIEWNRWVLKRLIKEERKPKDSEHYDSYTEYISKPKPTKPSWPINQNSYEKTNQEVGCGSKYSKDKKEDIFNSYYKNHWMVWRGEIVSSKADRVSLNIDRQGLSDLSVNFADKNAGYHLINGSFISVRFLMKSMGGCVFPFYGYNARIM